MVLAQELKSWNASRNQGKQCVWSVEAVLWDTHTHATRASATRGVLGHTQLYYCDNVDMCCAKLCCCVPCCAVVCHNAVHVSCCACCGVLCVMQVVEAALGLLPFSEKTIITPTGQQLHAHHDTTLCDVFACDCLVHTCHRHAVVCLKMRLAAVSPTFEMAKPLIVCAAA